MLGFMAVSGIFGLRNLQKLRLAVRFPDEIYAGIPAQLTLQLTSGRRLLPHYLLTLHVCGAETAVEILRPQEKREEKLLVTFTVRGPASVTKAAVTSPFPVNFFIRSNLFQQDASCLVFPRPLPLPPGRSHEDPRAAGSSAQPKKGSSGETEAIGAYTEAEPLKQIHWKLSARHDELLVKEMSTESGQPVIIETDRLPGDGEERLGHAAFLINSLMLSGRAVGLKIGGQSIPPGSSRSHRLTMLAELARHGVV